MKIKDLALSYLDLIKVYTMRNGVLELVTTLDSTDRGSWWDDMFILYMQKQIFDINQYESSVSYVVIV